MNAAELDSNCHFLSRGIGSVVRTEAVLAGEERGVLFVEIIQEVVESGGGG